MKYNHIVDYHAIINPAYYHHLGWLYTEVKYNLIQAGYSEKDSVFIEDVFIDVLHYLYQADLIKLTFSKDIEELTAEMLNKLSIDKQLDFIRDSMQSGETYSDDPLCSLEDLWWECYSPAYVSWKDKENPSNWIIG